MKSFQEKVDELTDLPVDDFRLSVEDSRFVSEIATRLDEGKPITAMQLKRFDTIYTECNRKVNR